MTKVAEPDSWRGESVDVQTAELLAAQRRTNALSQEYFDQTLNDYIWFWRLPRHFGMHCGFHQSKQVGHDQAVLEMNRALADEIDLAEGDRVLDAGCGVGGSAFWMAQKRGARVVGLNLNPEQIRLAEAQQEKLELGNEVSFVQGDFTNSNLPENSFDVVWALESSCYAVKRELFLQEAFRLTRPGGRLIVGDVFLFHDPQNDAEQSLVDRWCEAWAVPSLPTCDSMKRACERSGWSDVGVRDITNFVMPTSNRMLLLSILFWPLGKAACLMGLRSKVQCRALRGGIDQYRIRRQNLGCYALVSAVKPL